MSNINYTMEPYDSNSPRLPIGFRVEFKSNPFVVWQSYLSHQAYEQDKEKFVDEVRKYLIDNGGRSGFDWSIQKYNNYFLVQFKDRNAALIFKMKFG